MTDDQMTEAVKRFLTKPLYNYALMIDGPWGCGKTYYVKKLILELEKDEYKTTYVSLYGIRDAYDISDAVYSRIFAEIAVKKLSAGAQKTIEGATILAKVSAQWGLKKLGAGTRQDIKNLAKLFPSMHNRIIIFDDLERCNCSVFEALGQINTFVEHSEAHVIIVANEAEIGRNNDVNRELQMMVALNHELQVDIPQTVQEQIHSFSGHDKKPTYTPDYVDRRRKAIFQGNDEYCRIKEKIVGQTIRYEPELKKVFIAILTSVQSSTTGLLKICGQKIDVLVAYAVYDKHPNIRTFQFFLEKCRTIFETIEDKYPETHEEIVLYCYRSCIRYMSGKPMPTWDADMGMQEFNGGLSLRDMMWGYRFIDDLIIWNSVDPQKICHVLERRSRQLIEEGKLEGDPYTLLNNWYVAEDEEVLKWMKQLNENIKTERYSPDLYPRIINYAATFHQKDVFKGITEEIIESMKESIRSMEITRLEDFHQEQFILHEASEELYHKYGKEIQDEIERRLEIEEDNDDVLTENDYDDWGSKLYNSLKNKDHISGHSFIYRNNPEVLAGLIKRSNNQQLEWFRQALRMIYYGNRIRYDKMADDYEHLFKLRELVKKIHDKEVKAIKSFVIKWLKDNLEEYCDRVQEEVERRRQRATERK